MTLDLDAPLRSGPPPKAASDGWLLKASAGILVLGVLAAANIFVLQIADPKPETLVLRQTPPPQNDAIQTTVQSDQTASRVENGVKIVYGTSENSEPAPDPAITGATQIATPAPAPPQPRPDGATEAFLSPGGAKVITLAPANSSQIGQPLEVAHLPEDTALEELGNGLLLPRVTPEGRRPMDIYARPWSGGNGKRIAIMIGGIGLSQTTSQQAIDRLPPEITLGVSPSGNSLNRWMRAARKKGHELIVQVPMEPFNFPDVNPGPETLRLSSSGQTNVERLQTSMAAITNYTGVSNYLGARFLANEQAITPIFREVGQRGLLFFNDGSAKTPGLQASASAMGIPYVEADLVIDASRTPAEINARLRALEDLASARGQAIGTGAALDLTIETVAAWANDAKKRGFEIVGVSALAD
ncbi:MAG: divergent polysaccharide deacetylase family protein [Pseudomonadota bacterium]